MVNKAQKKKVGKERLDKYYHYAKEQGYRARSAFKLIQIARKYDILTKARSCIDLCGAPGGWTQVAAKNMPYGSKIIAVDLAPIKPIKGVVTFQADITTAKCRAMLKKELALQKCDVVLNDGAPNVGSSWSKDAYGQAELTLHAAKLACEFMFPGGTFVTKVFRSADYNSLLWIFQQLFKKVEVMKPPSSRAVSAEIFVICMGYKAPEKLDPRFFDPKFVFMQTVEDKPLLNLNDEIKRADKKNRSGYDEGDDFRMLPASEFFESTNPAGLIVNAHVITFKSEECKRLKEDELTTAEVLAACEDIRVLGKGDLNGLMKWRNKIKRRDEKKEEAKQKLISQAEGGDIKEIEMTEEEKLAKDEAELEHIISEQVQKERAERKKLAELKKKQEWRKKMSMGVFDGNAEDVDIFSASKRSVKALAEADKYLTEENLRYDIEDDDPLGEERELEQGEVEGRLDQLSRIDQMEVDMDVQLHLQAESRNKKELARMEAKKKETRRQRVTKEWAKELSAFTNTIDEKAEAEHIKNQQLSDSDEDDSDDDMQGVKDQVGADRWFSQDIFKDFMEPEGAKLPTDLGGSDDESDVDIQELDENEVPHLPLTDRQKRKLKRKKDAEKAKLKKKDDDDSDGELEIVPQQAPEDIEADAFKPETNEELAETLAIGSMMIHKKSRMEVIDAAYNRFAWNDPEDLPEWFVNEESKYSKPEMPVSKELMDEYRRKLREINARPIRKVAEARARNKCKVEKRMARIRKQAQQLSENQDISQISKVKQMKSMLSAAKRKDERVTVYSATKKGGGGVKVGKGKLPKNAKVKLVDKRMKQDKRSEKRANKKKGLKSGQTSKYRVNKKSNGKSKR